MSYEVYSISGAPRPWRVMLAFVVKGIPFTLKNLDASKKEHKASAFLALNPRGRVPVLVDGERVLTESLAILAYLDEVHPAPSLFGSSTMERARVWQMASEAEHDVNDACAALTRPLFFHGKDHNDEDVRRAVGPVREELARLDARLAGAPYLAGEQPTAADCVCFPHVRLVARAAERFPAVMSELGLHPLGATWPSLARWLARIEALPGYERTFPAHWRT